MIYIERKHIYWVLIIIVIFFITGCATIVQPTGGEKDLSEPKLLNSLPPNNTLNYRGKNIQLYFNKFVKLNNVNGNVIISPPMDNLPDFSIKGKSVVINLNEEPKDSTTYTLTLDNAITDIRENTPVKDFDYVFTTGGERDSMCITGKVLNAQTLKQEKEIYILAYLKNNDSVVFKELPVSIARTDAKGIFMLKNLKNTSYKVIAIKDDNRNLKYDPAKEQIAFFDKKINPLQMDSTKRDSIKASVNTLYLFQESETRQRIIKTAAVSRRQAQLIFSQPIIKPHIIPLNYKAEKEWNIIELSSTRDTVNIWFHNDISDTVRFIISDKYQDTSVNYQDTVGIVLHQRTSSRSIGKGKPMQEHLSYRINISKAVPYDYYRPIILTFPNPLDEFNFRNIKLIDSKDTLHPLVEFADSVRRKVSITYTFREGHNYKLYIKPTSFKDIYGLANDTIQHSFKTQETKVYGMIRISNLIKDKSTPKILQLLNENDKLIREAVINGNENYNFEYLYPGKYRLKFIYDLNGNGRWDTGKYITQLQPERVKIYPALITVRSNWETEIEIKDL